MSQLPTTILMLSANPKGTDPLRLDEERREIEAGLMERSRLRDNFRLVTKTAVRPRDFQRAMLDRNPQIVHFSGHGGGEPGLVLEDDGGKVKFVDGKALAGLFELFTDLQCVVLNACYSETQAKAIAQHIPYVIGMNAAIGDRAAIEFAVGFYDALGAGRDIEFAYQFACRAIQLAGIPEHLTPVLIRRSSNSETSSRKDAGELQQLNTESVDSSDHQVRFADNTIPSASSHRSSRRFFTLNLFNFKANRLAFMGLVTALLLGAVAIGTSSLLQEKLGFGKPACIAQAEREGKLVVVINEFQSVGSNPTEAPSIEKRLLDRLTTRLPQKIATCLITTSKVSSDSDARKIGKQWGATLMLWGEMNPLALEFYITTVDVKVPRRNTLSLAKTDAEDFKVQIQILPEVVYVITAVALGNIYEENKKYLEARKVLKDSLDWIELIKLDWNNIYIAQRLEGAYFRLGQLYSSSEDWTCSKTRQDCITSLQAYQTASVINPNNQRAFVEQGILHTRLGNTNEAVEIYSLTIKASPESEEGLQSRSLRADIYLDMGKYSKAVEDLQFMCKHFSGDYEWLSYLGQAQLLAGQIEEFESTYSQVRTLVSANKKEQSIIVKELQELAKSHPQLAFSVQKVITSFNQ
jgi:CHAT domain